MRIWLHGPAWSSGGHFNKRAKSYGGQAARSGQPMYVQCDQHRGIRHIQFCPFIKWRKCLCWDCHHIHNALRGHALVLLYNSMGELYYMDST